MQLLTQVDFLDNLPQGVKSSWEGNVCGLACLSMITGETPKEVLNWIVENNGWDNNKGWRHDTLISFLTMKGYNAKGIHNRLFPKRILRSLENTDSVLIASMNTEEGSHLVVVKDCIDDNIKIFDPGTKSYIGYIINLTRKEFLSKWRRYGILVTL